MNQLKILSLNGVSRTFDYTVQGNTKQGYSVPCNCDVDGIARTAELTSFSPKIRDKIFVGAVLINGKDADISSEESQQYGLKIKLKAVKQDNVQHGQAHNPLPKGNFQPKKYITREQYSEVIDWCADKAKQAFPDKAVEAFDKILGVYSVLIDLAPEDKTAPASSPPNSPSALTRDSFDAAVTVIKSKTPEVQVDAYKTLWKKVMNNKASISEELFKEIHLNFVLCAGYDPFKNVSTQNFSCDDIPF
jgi:hypothetical protein